jgi:hypothetical protein
MTLQTDEPRSPKLDKFLQRIDELVSPIATEHAQQLRAKRLQLVRARFEHALIDLELAPMFNITVDVERSSICLRAIDTRARERLLAFLEHAAQLHAWGSRC